MEYKTIEVENNRIIGIQKNNVYRVVFKAKELSNAKFRYDENCDVVGYDSSGHRRALSKFKRPKENAELAIDYKIRAHVLAAGKEISQCNMCSLKTDGPPENPVQFLTPSGERSFYFSKGQETVLAFLLKCRPSKHNCNSFTLRIEFINCREQNKAFLTDIYLETRKRERRESVDDSRRSSVDLPSPLPQETRRGSIDEINLNTTNQLTRRYSYDPPPVRRPSYFEIAPTSSLPMPPVTTTTTTTTMPSYNQDGFYPIPSFQQPPKRRFSDQVVPASRRNSFETRRFSVDTAITELRRPSEEVEHPIGSPVGPVLEEEQDSRPTKQLKITRAMVCPEINPRTELPKYMFYSEPYSIPKFNPRIVPNLRINPNMHAPWLNIQPEVTLKPEIINEARMYLPQNPINYL